jgi:GTP:adenosylcobinamide-phosphate guanylyltransferase
MVDGPQRTYPVIMTAGDRGRARLIHGTNKALLELAGAPVFTHVLAALEECPSIDRIYLVGPRSALSAALEASGIPFKGRRPVRVLEQWENLYQNVWNTFQTILQEREGEGGHEDTAVLVVPSDIPLVIPEEVEEFVRACDMEQSDYSVGITAERVLSLYYPQKRRRGIRLMYFHMREGSFRQNNLHLVKPFSVRNRTYIQKTYDYRLQREWGSIVRLFWEMFRTEEGTLRMLGQYVLLHLASILYRIPQLSLHRIPATFIPKNSLEMSISNLLGTRFVVAETHYGGAALDIDTPEHYAVIQENFEAWKRVQRDEALRVAGFGNAACPPFPKGETSKPPLELE